MVTKAIIGIGNKRNSLTIIEMECKIVEIMEGIWLMMKA
jgi:hypothetical protein